MASSQEHQQLHFILIPLMAQGHMIPMIDMAKLLAQRNMAVTLVTTTLNAARFKPNIDRAMDSGLRIRLLQLQFPCLEVGLPEGCENLDIIPFSGDMLKKFFVAIDLLQKPVEHFLQEQLPRPSCIISDMGIAWTCETAQKLRIPRLVFHGTGCFSLLCTHNIYQCNAHESVASELEPFVIPGLPHLIEITRAQLPGMFAASSEIQSIRAKIREAESTAYGVVINSFDELELEYVDMYRKATGKKTWAVGPMSLCNKETLDKVDRGNKASINEDLCISWLNSRKPKSVIYACFGSICRLTSSQLMEIGLGLEASNRSFIWAIRSGNQSAEIEKWLSEEFEERVKDRGLIIRGWAPQILILSHPSMGGFLTHCGWNSTLEGICAGMPMITWPLCAEQFLNEKMIVHILAIGVSVGIKKATRWEQEDNVGELVKMEEVKKAVERLMDKGQEGEERRSKASEIGVEARRAMDECGSSYINMTHLIQDIMDQSSNSLSNKDKTANKIVLERDIEVDNSTKGC